MRGSSIVAAGVLLLAAGCQSGESDSRTRGTTSRTTPASAAAAAPTSKPTTLAADPSAGPDIVTLVANNIRLFNSEGSDAGFRVLVDSAAGDMSVVLSGVPSPNRTVFVCPARALDQFEAASGCPRPGEGEPARVAHSATYPGVEVVQLGAAGTGLTATTTALTAIAVTFTPRTREVRLRLPPLRPGGAGEPASFRLSPAGGLGAYRAGATWDSGSSGRAELSLLAGATVSAQSEGGAGIALDGTLSPPAEATVRLRNTGPTTLTGLTLTVLFP